PGKGEGQGVGSPTWRWHLSLQLRLTPSPGKGEGQGVGSPTWRWHLSLQLHLTPSPARGRGKGWGHQLGDGVYQLLAPGTLPTCGEGSGEGDVEPLAASIREHRRMKFARIFLPSFVSTDSGWNCTP